MLKKKLIHRSDAKPTNSKVNQGLGSLMKKKPNKVVDEDEVDEDSDEVDGDEPEEEEETTNIKSIVKSKLKRQVVEEEEEEDEAPVSKKPISKLKKGRGKVSSSLANAFSSIPLSNNADDVPTGKHEAIVSDIVIQEPGEKGTSARVKYELCEEEFSGKNELTTWFKLLDEEMEPHEVGFRMFRGMLAKLGYEPESPEELEEVVAEVKKDRPGVLISVSYSKDYPDFPRVKVEGPCDNEVVEAYKDNVPFED
jgi:hypothetical protein